MKRSPYFSTLWQCPVPTRITRLASTGSSLSVNPASAARSRSITLTDRVTFAFFGARRMTRGERKLYEEG